MNKRISHYKRQQAGFSLIEIMVAVVISMLAMIVVLQIYGGSEAKKRATTGGNDAQMGGALALSGLQRDVRQAGFGMSSLNLLGCDLKLPGGTLNRLAPVTINHTAIPAGDDHTDTLVVAYGVSDGTPEGDLVSTMPGANNVLAMNRPFVFNINDFVIAVPSARPSPCVLALDQVTAVTPSPTIKVKKDSSGMSFGTVFNMGHDNADTTRGPQFLVYRVHKGNLTMCDYMVNDCGSSAKKDDDSYWVPIASNIVSLRAQYGRDTSTAMDGIVDAFDQVQPDPANAKFTCQIARISAVRIALVARSSDYDKNAPTTANNGTAPVWDGSLDLPIDLSSNTTWQNYRYKVFQTVVPIRTMSWLGPQPGC